MAPDKDKEIDTVQGWARRIRERMEVLLLLWETASAAYDDDDDDVPTRNVRNACSVRPRHKKQRFKGIVIKC